MTTKWKWLIGLSLVLNVFLLATIAGAAFVVHHHMRDFRRPMGMESKGDEAERRLSPASRQRILAVVRQAALAGEADLEKARAIRGQAGKLAAAQPYDAAKIAALSDEARGYEDQARAKVENALIQAMEPLAPEERAAIAGHMLRPSFKFRHLNHDRDGPPAGASASASASASR